MDRPNHYRCRPTKENLHQQIIFYLEPAFEISMKRLSAIVFLLVLVFNLYGYRVAVLYLEKKNEAAWEQKLDKQDFKEAELLSIKTKLHLPYYTRTTDFERAYGTITVGNVVYEYVQKRVYQDTLELRCLPNATKTKLQQVKNELTKSTAGDEASVPVKKGMKTIKLSFPDYCQMAETALPLPVFLPSKHRLQNNYFLKADFTCRQERPPQLTQAFLAC